MPRIDRLTPEFVQHVPADLVEGVLYVSREFATAIHLCACGCGNQTVTPIDLIYGWELTVHDGRVTLSPSIGNFAFPCRSHYWIRDNMVVWA